MLPSVRRFSLVSALRPTPKRSASLYFATALQVLVLCLAWPKLGLCDEAFFGQIEGVGRTLIVSLMKLSALGATLGFILAGHAFSSGDVERGKTLLKGTIIGSVCIFGSVGLVAFIQERIGEPKF